MHPRSPLPTRRFPSRNPRRTFRWLWVFLAYGNALLVLPFSLRTTNHFTILCFQGSYFRVCLSCLFAQCPFYPYRHLLHPAPGGRGVLISLLALVIWPLTTHLFRDEAPFLLLIETPPTIGRSSRCFHILHIFFLLIVSPSCLAVCGHHLSPRIAIVS